MTDENLSLLIEISKNLAFNTKATEGIETHLKELNGKVAKNSLEISMLKRNLIIIGTVAATLLITNGSDLVTLILKII